ncbi:hypothetical protein ACLB2K_059413 [Fragaria x ananassa]
MGRGGAAYQRRAMKRAEEGRIAYLAPRDKKKLDEVEGKLMFTSKEQQIQPPPELASTAITQPDGSVHFSSISPPLVFQQLLVSSSIDGASTSSATLARSDGGMDASENYIRPLPNIFGGVASQEEIEGQLLCFDVADPKATWSDREPRIRNDMGVFPEIFNKVLVVDSEEEEDEKLVFTFDYEKIIVSCMVLFEEI